VVPTAREDGARLKYVFDECDPRARAPFQRNELTVDLTDDDCIRLTIRPADDDDNGTPRTLTLTIERARALAAQIVELADLKPPDDDEYRDAYAEECRACGALVGERCKNLPRDQPPHGKRVGDAALRRRGSKA